MILPGILKTAGVLLLVLLLICLLFLLLLMTVPFRYRICGSISGNIPEGKLRLTWFMKAVSLRLQAEKGGSLTGELKLLGFRYLKVYLDLRKKAEDTETENVPAEDSRQQKGTDAGKKEDRPLNCLFDDVLPAREEKVSGETQVPEASECGREPEEGRAETGNGGLPDAAQEKQDRNSEIRPIRRKQYRDRLEKAIHSLWDRISKRGRHLRELLKQDYIRLRDSSEGLIGKLREILAVIGQEEYSGSYELLKKQSIRVIKSVLPRAGSGETEFGFGDPWKTGKVLEILALLYPLYGSWFEVTPLFEEDRFFCRLDVKGKITLGILVYGGLRIYLDRGLRNMYREIMKVVRGT